MAATHATKRYSWLANLPGRHKIRVAIWPLLGLFLLTSLATFDALRQQDRNHRLSQHTYDVLLAIDQLKQAGQDSEIAARGYMLSPASAELVALAAGQQRVAQGIANLRSLTLDNPLQQARIDQMGRLTSQWSTEIATEVVAPLRALPPTDPAQGLADRMRVRGDYLAHLTVAHPQINDALEQMAATERQLLGKRKQDLQTSIRALRLLSALTALAGLLFGIYAIGVTNRLVTVPLRQITDTMNRVAARDTSVKVTRLGRRDEIGEIARALQVFKQMVIDTGEKAWVKSQLGTISQRLQEAATHREFGQSLTSQLAPLLNAGVAIYYTYDARSERLDLLGSYGLHQSWKPGETYVPGEGLVGQCVIEGKPIVLDRVPEHYLRIHSGSGESAPSHLAILPVMYRDRITGVLELAGFEALTSTQRELLDELLPLLALTQENLTRAIATQELLERTQQQAEDLRVSELVMRQQKEVLHDNNETLLAKTAELEEQSERLIASEEELRVQAEELQASNEELREKTDSLNRQKHILEQLQQETAGKAAELARASQYKSDFLANMSHELRTPLNSLLILSRSLADNERGNLDAEQIESARIIHDAGNNLLHLINDILDLSKVEAGKMELVPENLVLTDLLQRLRRMFAHVAEAKGLDFTLEIEPGLPPVLRTDGNKLAQIANNLLSNAFKFTAHGSVGLRLERVRADALIPEALRGRPLLALTVSDTGIGIAPDKFERVFNAFEQVDAGTSRQFGGTGLGLTISRQMAKLLGGDIVLDSKSGHGSRFTVLLPETPPSLPDVAAGAGMEGITRVASSDSSQLLAATIDDDRGSLRPGQTTILVIEDDPSFVRILIDMIHRKGYRALAALDGEAGLQLAREHRPTGILLDVTLPAMDGWSVLDQLKTDQATRAIPVHFISASDIGAHRLASGAVGFLTKPVSRESIGTAIERLLHFAAGQQRRLLVVDDETDSRTAVRTMLRGDTVQIDEAASAEDALEQIAHHRYDCVVLDLGLPGMSGFELLERLAATAAGVPPVVVYSGRELGSEESLRLRQYTDAIVLKGERSRTRLLDEVSLFLHSIRHVPEQGAAGSAAPAELTGHRVLLVDDDMRNLFALSKVLRGWGLQVSLAPDGQKALRMLAEDQAPELVLMDIMMPGMDGYATMRAIRAQPPLASLPIIALTAKAMRGDRERCLEMGASDYLSKPIDLDKLASMLRVWLKA